MRSVIQEVDRESKSVKYKLESEISVPVPEKNEVQVQVKACALSSVNQKVLLELLRKSPKQQFIVGHDVAGIVTAVGHAVTHVAKGDAVLVGVDFHSLKPCDYAKLFAKQWPGSSKDDFAFVFMMGEPKGMLVQIESVRSTYICIKGVLSLLSSYSGCGEYCLFHEYDLVKKPEMLSFDDAAAGIGDCIRAYTALKYQGHLCAGDTILVLNGVSSFGCITIQLALHWGAKVITTVSSTEEKKFLKGNLPSIAQIVELDSRCSMLTSNVMEETGGLGVDIVIDAGVKLFTDPEDIALMEEMYKYPTPHKYSIISCLGASGKWLTSQHDLQLDPPDSRELYLRNASVCFLFEHIWTLSYSQHGRYQHILSDAVDKLDRSILRPKICKVVTLDNAVQALESLADQRIGKIIVQMGSNYDSKNCLN